MGRVDSAIVGVSISRGLALRQPRWALLAQISWLVLAVVVAVLFGSGLPGFVEHASSVCLLAPCEAGGLTPDRLAALAAVGLTSLAYATWLALIGATLAVVYTVVGGLLVWRRPTDRMAVFAAFTLLLFGGVTFTDLGSFVAQANPALRLPFAVLDLLGRASFTAFVFVFPDGHFAPGWTRWVALAWIAVQAPVPFLSSDQDSPLLAFVDFWTNPAFVLGLITAAFGQVYRYRRLSTPAQRQQTRWTAFGLASGLGLFLAFGVVQLLVPGASAPVPALVIGTLGHLAMTLVPLSIAVALLWHGLYNVDALIGRTLVYAALTA